MVTFIKNKHIELLEEAKKREEGAAASLREDDLRQLERLRKDYPEEFKKEG